MRVLVMSSPKDEPDEITEVVRMFDAGLEHFHVRKPSKNRKQLVEYLELFPSKFRSRLIIHSYHGLATKMKLGGIHLSRKHRKRGKIYQLRLFIKRRIEKNLLVTRTFHKITDLTEDKRKYSYAFLSPVFDSITHSALSRGFSKRALLIAIPQARQPIYAMGGIRPERFEEIVDLGFEGAVLVGSVWSSDEPPHCIFKKALETANQMA